MKREIQKPRMTRASDDWFCGEKSPVTDRDKKLSFATKVTICINWSRHSLSP